MKKSKGARAIKKVAVKERVSVAEVRGEIEKAINEAMADPDPAVRAYWAGIPKKGEKPTPEEVIAYMADNIR